MELIIAVTVIHTAIVAVILMLGISQGDEEKNSSYECGFQAFETESQTWINFFATAISFLVFDVELVILLPWISDPRWTVGVFVFVDLLIITLAIEIFEGMLEWEIDVE
jgi:NADH-quinone oxidoreductase subunit A